MTDQRGRVHAAQLVLRNTEGHDRGIFGPQTLVRKLLVERHVAVAVDRADHRSPSAGGEFLQFAADGLVVLMVERRVFFHNAVHWHFLRQEHRPQDFVGGAGIHVIGTEQIELRESAPLFAHQIIHRRHGLLIRGRSGVEDVA